MDRRWDQFQGGSDGQFGFIDAEDDPAIFEALLEVAEGWVRERGRDRLVGPMDFTTNDEVGLLIEGYDEHPYILEPWHPPYYKERIEALGYGKTMDLFMWNLEMGGLKEGDAFADAIHAVADKVESEHGITVRNMNKRDLEAKDEQSQLEFRNRLRAIAADPDARKIYLERVSMIASLRRAGELG